MAIDNFHKSPYEFLSNFYQHPIKIGAYGIWPSVEHFYQAMKTVDNDLREQIRNLKHPAEAKKFGKNINVRSNWDEIKLNVMRYALKYKFQDPILRQKLLETGDEELIEGNYWKDTFWGVCQGKGLNWLGRILMEVRSSLETKIRLPKLQNCNVRQYGDIFTAPTDTLINPVNCVGVMGKGLALEFKKRFPTNFEIYKSSCEIGYLKPGQLFIFNENGKQIINFPTKEHYRDQSTYKLIELGLDALEDYFKDRNIDSCAMPLLGCGLGGLEWNKVCDLIETHTFDLKTLYICYK